MMLAKYVIIIQINVMEGMLYVIIIYIYIHI